MKEGEKMAKFTQLLNELKHAVLPDDFVDFWCEELGLLHRQQGYVARVLQRRPETENCISLWLQPARSYPGFKPGQHINLSRNCNGRRITRSYSPSQPAEPGSPFRITVQQVDGGLMSSALCQQTRPGDFLEISPGFGEFKLPEAAPLLLLAGGSGLTPLAALFHQAAQSLSAGHTLAPVVLLHWSREDSQTLFADELNGLADSLPTLQYRAIKTPRDQKRLNPEDFQLEGFPLDKATVFACGPDGFVRSTQERLGEHCKHFVTESFRPLSQPVVPSSTEQVSVHLKRQNKTLLLSPELTLLDALEQAGEHPDYGCRRGICHTCSCEKLQGQTLSIEGRSHSEPGTIQLCTQRPSTDLILDL